MSVINSMDEWAVQTPAQTFESDVNRDIAALETWGRRAAMVQSQKQSNERLTVLRGNLILAWRNLVEESSNSEALSVIAADVHNLATEMGAFHQQERFILADELFTISEAAGRSNL